MMSENIIIRGRHTVQLGASPAALPVGVYELSVKLQGEGKKCAVMRLLMEELKSTRQDFFVRLKSGNDVEFRCSHNKAANTLSYSLSDASDTVQVTAICEILP